MMEMVKAVFLGIWDCVSWLIGVVAGVTIAALAAGALGALAVRMWQVGWELVMGVWR